MSSWKLSPRPAPPRFPLLRPRRVERSDRCINCGTCLEACLFGCHERRTDDPRKMADPKTACCKNCYACVLRCPRGALSLCPDTDYLAQGDTTYTPDVFRSLLEQAAEGKIPVSGAGYGGPFDGPGYDNLWTDMSEIVRPTRDGIHGRENISTTITLGRLVQDLCGLHFDAQGNLKSPIPPTRGIALPILFGVLPFSPGGAMEASLALAASKLTTYATVRAGSDITPLAEYFNHLIVLLKSEDIERHRELLEWASIVEFETTEDPISDIRRVREINPQLLTILRLPVRHAVERTVLDLAQAGAETLHLCADTHGKGTDGTKLLGALRDSHRLLVKQGVRDRVTLLASGGIAAAEHVPKTIVLGADAVVIDVPLLIALECDICAECREQKPCPRQIDGIDRRWGATRVINLMLAWRDQLLEVLGAMGLRDVRRLRGETGRVIFADRAREDFRRRIEEEAEHAGGNERSVSLAAGDSQLASCRLVPDRFANPTGAYKIRVDRERCTNCTLCVECCRFSVHRRPEGKLALDEPRHDRCIGPECLKNDWCCVNVCPLDALAIETDPAAQSLGDRRWTPSILRETYRVARTGSLPKQTDLVQRGDSAGGFDLLRLSDRAAQSEISSDTVDLGISLNRRQDGPQLSIPIPIYGGGMSYGSISLAVMCGRAQAAKVLGTFTSTGEGGYPPELIPYADNVITQVATGLFGVREETIQRARLVEFKYAQGAKPGLGGHLLGEKNTPDVAVMRQAVRGTSLFSPFPFHSVYSVEDHKKHLDWIRAIHPDVLLSVKVSTPADVDMVAVGSYYAGANIVHLDGSYGGTGAAPDIAKKNIAQPIEYGVIQAHDFLVKEGIRDKVVLLASGGIRTPDDVLKTIALGADGVVIGTAELVAIDCVRCGNCERNRGCPIGIATTDPILSAQLTPEFVRDRIVNLYTAWASYLRKRLARLGISSIREFRGRRDLLRWVEPGGTQ
jgi:glutamate synthase domain-containing protein 2/NAD-dependent dihydropyrimidine dehydrogenase PreA subunit